MTYSINELEKSFLKHKELKFPKFPEDDNLSEWLEELIEIDSYYVGIISSLIENKKLNIDEKMVDIKFLNNLNNSLMNFSITKKDMEVFKECKLYLKSLKDLVMKFLMIN